MASLITGAKLRNSILGVHSQGELIGYSSLIVGYGFWGDIIIPPANFVCGGYTVFTSVRPSVVGILFSRCPSVLLIWIWGPL